MTIIAKDLGIKYNNNFEIAPSFDLTVLFEKVNYSPYLEDSYCSKGINFEELDISYYINLNFSPVHFRFR